MIRSQNGLMLAEGRRAANTPRKLSYWRLKVANKDSAELISNVKNSPARLAGKEQVSG